jgi:hypothetical protein
MKLIKHLTVAVLVMSVLSSPLAGLAADQKNDAKAKPYPLKTCVVSGEKLGEMGDAYVFVQDGQEVKLCCKGCLKDFKKDPAKYLKKISEAQAKAQK